MVYDVWHEGFVDFPCSGGYAGEDQAVNECEE